MPISEFVAVELDKIARNEGFLDYEIEKEPGSKHGDGFVANMLAVTLVGKRKVGAKITDSKLHLMCKLLPENSDRCDMFDTASIFEREIYVYNKIFGTFDQFQSEKNIPMEDRFTEHPKSYGTASDTANGQHVIIMENLKSTGYGLLDRTDQVDYRTVCLFMKALGKLHAISFALRDQKPKLFDEISALDDIIVRLLNRNNIFEMMLQGGIDKGLSLLDQQEDREILENIKINFKDEVIRLLDKKLAGDFYVLCHGDSWNNNLFYSNEGKVR